MMGLQLSRKSLIAIGATAILVAAAVAVSGSGDTSAQATEKLSACLLEDAAAARTYQLGEGFGSTGKVSWKPLEALGCPGFVTFVSNDSFRDVVEEHTGRTLLLEHEFRKGMYAGYAAALNIPAEERTRLGALGVYLEEGVKPAVTAQFCEALPANGSEYLETIVFPFTLAATGNQAPSLTDEQVYKVAQLTIDSVRDAASYVVESGYDCSPDKNIKQVEKLLDFLDAMGRFRDGRHELAPGCSAEVLLDEVKLKCVGADGAEALSRSVGGVPVV